MRIRQRRCWLQRAHVQKEGTEVLPGWEEFKQNAVAGDESADQKCSSSRNQS